MFQSQASLYRPRSLCRPLTVVCCLAVCAQWAPTAAAHSGSAFSASECSAADQQAWDAFFAEPLAPSVQAAALDVLALGEPPPASHWAGRFKRWLFGFWDNTQREEAKRSQRQDSQEDAATVLGLSQIGGLEGAKQELHDVLGVLHGNEDYARLRVRMPRGLLLSGPPGTGKTLLARALAQEAHVAFFAITASVLRSKYVGEGGERVRNLFAQARKHAPAIVFIDEIDAIGQRRFEAGPEHGDERQSTLNELLSQLDGFAARDRILVVAATNAPDLLDPALVRAGRFDRHIRLTLPDEEGRLAILTIHTKNMPLADDVSLAHIAWQSFNMSGAELATLCNEAATIAARRGSTSVAQADFLRSLLRVRFGVQGSPEASDANSRYVAAVHEIGHAFVSELAPGRAKVVDVTIDPFANGVGGATRFVPRSKVTEYVSLQAGKNDLAMLLGGRAAQTLIFGHADSGSADDIAKATAQAYEMVSEWGLDEGIGAVSLPALKAQSGAPPSPALTAAVESAVQDLLAEAAALAECLLLQRKDQLLIAARQLVLKGTLDQAAIVAALEGEDPLPIN